MAHLLDTSILARLANSADAQHATAVAELHRRGETLHIAPQNLLEFRSVATRPTNVNGLGLTAEAAEALEDAFEASFPLLSETPDIFPTWKAIARAHGVMGKQVHDARLVAVCHVHRITHILTFNVGHFTRFAGFGPGIVVVNPADVTP